MNNALPTIDLALQQTTRTKLVYRLPLRFYVIQLLTLTLLGLLFSWLSRNGTLDRHLTGYWFDAASRHFPWQENPWLDVVNHRLAKYCTIALALGCLLYGLLQRYPRLVAVSLLMGLGVLAVSLLKNSSDHSCPWSLVEYGGHAVSYPLFGSVPVDSGPGRCFPGGHASSGFMVMALFFAFYRERPRLAWCCLAAGVALGLLMGYGQVMRGAHFFTHNLWAGWWVWLTQVVGYALFSHWFVKDHNAL